MSRNINLKNGGEITVQLPWRVDRAGMNAENPLDGLNACQRPQRGNAQRRCPHAGFDDAKPLLAIPFPKIDGRALVDDQQVYPVAKRIADDPVVVPADRDEAVAESRAKDLEAGKGCIPRKYDNSRCWSGQRIRILGAADRRTGCFRSHVHTTMCLDRKMSAKFSRASCQRRAAPPSSS